jgi:hypothetical protein
MYSPLESHPGHASFVTAVKFIAGEAGEVYPNLSQFNPNLSQLNPELSQFNPNLHPQAVSAVSAGGDDGAVMLWTMEPDASQTQLLAGRRQARRYENVL